MYGDNYEYGEQNRGVEVEMEYTSLYDPFLVQTLQSLLGRMVTVETSKGTVRGKLADVKPDHICVQTKDAQFLIRIQEIVWVMPC
ncbi:MAG: YuzF family protein [Bacillus sp. (in: Bacteria)]|nr:YuzF family protein [Bacillus sp. (in: firmicutes)]